MLHHTLRTKSNRWAQYLGYVQSDNTANITIPSTNKVGDIAILIDSSYGGLFITPSAVIPSNWTQFINNFAASQVRFCFSWKVLSVSDPGSTITGMPRTGELTGGACTKIMALYRIYNGRGSPSIVDTESYEGSGAPPAQTVNASNYGYGSITCAYAWGNGISFNSGTFDNSNISGDPYNVFGYKLNNLTKNNNIIDTPDILFELNTLQTWLIIDQ